MRWIWWVIGAIFVIGLYILFFCLAAACEPTSPEEEIRLIREDQKRRLERERRRKRRNEQ